MFGGNGTIQGKMKTAQDYTYETMHMSNPTHHWGFFPS
jgi:hypothetical protein